MAGLTPLKVVVIGGGLCGLSVAIALQRAGIDVHLYESAAKFGEIGAGVALGPNAIRALQKMDLLDTMLDRIKPEVPRILPFLFLSGVDHEIYYDYPHKNEDIGLGIHRAEYLDSLVHLLESARVHFHKRCIGTKRLDDGQMQIAFADGTTVQADVLLGADGIRSNVRTFVLGEDSDEERNIVEEDGKRDMIIRVAFTNTVAYRGLVTNEEAMRKGLMMDLTKRPHCFIGEDKHIITFPIKDNKIINIVAFFSDRGNAVPSSDSNEQGNYVSDDDIDIGSASLSTSLPSREWVTPRSTSELLDRFSDFSPSLRSLLSCITNPSAWAIHSCAPPISSYARGRVALLGDAAHAMPPHLGAGAGQAIEDAYVMGRLLAHPDVRRDNVEAILSAYSNLRKPRANQVLAGSHRAGEAYELRGPKAHTSTGVAEDLEGQWEFVWRYDLEAAVDRTIDELERQGVL